MRRRRRRGNNSTNIYLVWTDCLPKIVSDEPLCDILFTKSTDNGNSFGKIINLSSNTGASLNPQISISTDEREGVSNSSNTVYVAWQDDSFTSSGNYDIFFTRVQMVGIASKVLRILVRLTELPVFKKWLLPLRAPFIWHGPT